MQQITLNQYVLEHTDGVLEEIAKQYQVSVKQVIECLPNRQFISADKFMLIWETVRQWGEVMFLLHQNDIIMEVETVLPEANIKHGYFNLQNKSGLSGHIKLDNCTDIVFIERKFMSFDTASIVFLNQFGQPMFKIFVGFDKQYQLIPEHLEKFRQLRSQLATA